MYDKYNKVLPIIVNQALPTHKGLFLKKSSATATVLVEYFGAGFTGSHAGTISLQSGVDYIHPIQVYKITNLDGATGFLLN